MRPSTRAELPIYTPKGQAEGAMLDSHREPLAEEGLVAYASWPASGKRGHHSKAKRRSESPGYQAVANLIS